MVNPALKLLQDNIADSAHFHVTAKGAAATVVVGIVVVVVCYSTSSSGVVANLKLGERSEVFFLSLPFPPLSFSPLPLLPLFSLPLSSPHFLYPPLFSLVLTPSLPHP